MSYATKADLGDRLTDKQLIELTDFDNAGVIVDSRITAAINDASAKIDSYAGARYSVPLAQSDQVKNLCLDLTVWRLFTNRNLPLPESMKNNYDASMKFLLDVSSGKATLDQPAAAQSSTMDVVKRDHDGDPEVFDNTKLTSF
jgi:phage gp36-like protein